MATKEFRGWVIVISLAILLGTVYGTTLSSISVFLLPVIETFGCTTTQASQATTAFMLAMTIALPVVGWMLDRVRPQIVMIGGILLTAMGSLIAAHSSTIAIYTAAMALSGVGVGASTYVPSIVVISDWITERRGLAFGILLSGGSIGSAAFPVLVTDWISVVGWRSTMQGITWLTVAIAIPILLLVRTNPMPSMVEAGKDGAVLPGVELGQALRMPVYWLFVLQQVLAMSSGMAIYFYIVPYMTAMGHSAHSAVLLYGATGITGLAGFILFGVLADRFGAMRALTMGFSICALGVLPLLTLNGLSPSLGAPLVFVVFWGATFSLSSQLAPLLLVDLLGARNFGVLIGISGFLSGLAGAVGPMGTALIYDTTKSYAPAFMVCALLMALAVVPALLMPVTSRKVTSGI
ncbi:MAG TPA: MFS transporter [Spongiibacteraceae bacterium]|nr:MFS transporter [Spongiibacteraceae bacterium]